jgi:hypothetical protein
MTPKRVYLLAITSVKGKIHHPDILSGIVNYLP